MNTQTHTPGPWAVALQTEYPNSRMHLSVAEEISDFGFNDWVGRINGVAQGRSGSEKTCWQWLERFAYFKAHGATTTALAQVQS